MHIIVHFITINGLRAIRFPLGMEDKAITAARRLHAKGFEGVHAFVTGEEGFTLWYPTPVYTHCRECGIELMDGNNGPMCSRACEIFHLGFDPWDSDSEEYREMIHRENELMEGVEEPEDTRPFFWVAEPPFQGGGFF